MNSNTYEVVELKDLDLGTSIPNNKLKQVYNIRTETLSSSNFMVQFNSEDRAINPIQIRRSVISAPFLDELEPTAFKDGIEYTGQNIRVSYLVTRIEDTCILTIQFEEANYDAVRILANTKLVNTIFNIEENINLVTPDTCRDTKVFMTKTVGACYEIIANLFIKAMSTITIETLEQVPANIKLTLDDIKKYNIMPFSIKKNESVIHIIRKFEREDGEAEYVLLGHNLKKFRDEIVYYLENQFV